MAHIHKVYDTDGHYIIDANTRLLTNAAAARVTLVQRDHNSERVTFELERFVDGHDMSLCSSVRISYTNKGAAGSTKGCYLVRDLQISPDDPSVVIFSWLISQHSTKYEGQLRFSIRFVCSSDGSTVDYAWNTIEYAGLTVSKGLSHDDVDDVYVYDSLQGWIDAANDCVAAAETAQSRAEEAQGLAQEAQKAATEAARLAQHSPLIFVTKTASGEGPLTLTDAAQGGNLMQLSLYGRTSQTDDGLAGVNGSVDVSITDGVNVQGSVVINPPSDLHGVPVSTGGNYTDAAGLQWIADEIDLARGKHVQRCGVIESYAGESVATAYISSTGDLSTGAKIVYVLAESVESDLTAEEIKAFAALRTYKPTTKILSSAGVGITVAYVKDLQEYVDNAVEQTKKGVLKAPGTAGSAGQVLALAADGSTTWADASVGGGALAAADEDDIPMVFLTGTLPTTKDDVKMGFQLVSKSMNVQGWCEIKCQGTSSMAYPKKNFTIKTFTDEALTEKLKFNFRGWGSQQKFCYKANWIDITHARNVVSARLWGDVVKSRANYDTIPEELRTAPNQGAVDGFFVRVFANGVYQGRYTLNIPKDKWMANMDDELETHCILCGENYGSGCFRAAAKIDGTDWSDEVHDEVPASILTRWNEVISFVRESTDEEFKANIHHFFDLESLIDYDVFALVACGLDSMGKNQLYMTYDGQKWYASMYDLDSTWGLYHNGSSIVPAKYTRYQYEDYVNGREGNLLYERLENVFSEEIKARYQELRAGALSMGNIISRFEHFMGVCSQDLIAEDYAATTANGAFVNIPSKSITSLQHIRNFVAARRAYCDEYFGLVGTGTIPATGITLNVTSLKVEPGLTATLTATPTPANTTDTIKWLSSDENVAKVENGVVTGVSKGTCYIYATCGDHMASCYLTVGSTAVDEFGALAYKAEGALMFDGTTLPIDTGWAPYDTENKDWTIAIKYSADLSHLTSGAQKTLVHTETPHSSGTNLTLWLFTYHQTWQTDELNYCVTSGSYEFHNGGHGLTLSDDGYHYAVVAKEGNMVYHYIDGNLIENKGFERIFPGTAPAHLYIGGIVGQAGLVGEIADVRIYDEYLSQADVTALTLAMKNGN